MTDLHLDRIHIAIAMQALFDPGPWSVPWLPRAAQVSKAVARHPDRTVVFAFIPPRQPEDRPGAWSGHYERWSANDAEEPATPAASAPSRRAYVVPPAHIATGRSIRLASPGSRLVRHGADTRIVSEATRRMF